MTEPSPLELFHPVVRRWFVKSFGEPTPAQSLGWPSIATGTNTLILAPTGSGKTLAAFLWTINHLFEQRLQNHTTPGVRVLYISPLKALSNDIERNLEAPLRGIREEAKIQGLEPAEIRTAVRTGDTPQSRRTAMVKHPPDILITTPESLYLILTSRQARNILRSVQYVIVDEIHSLGSNKRGVHLSLSLQRLATLTDTEFVRIGLSATQRPNPEIASFLGGLEWKEKQLIPRRVSVVDAGKKKQMDLRVVCAAQDLSELPQEGLWPLVFQELTELIRQHRTTLIFVNNRRLAERVAAKLNDLLTGEQSQVNLHAVPEVIGRMKRKQQFESPAGETTPDFFHGELISAYHGSMSRDARERMESDLKGGRLRALVATSSLELGIDIGSIDLVVQLQSPKGVSHGLQRVGRSGHLISSTSKGRIFPTHREDLVEATVIARAMLAHDVEDTPIPENCLDIVAQQIVAMVSVEEWEVDRLFDVIRQSYCYRNLSRKLYLGVLNMLAGRYETGAFRELRARVSWDRVNNALRALPGTMHAAIAGGGTIPDRGYYGVYLEDGKTKLGEVDEEFVFESRVGDTFILGTGVWKVSAIDANRISVTPAPGEPARMPFWRGEGLGRSLEIGRLVGAFRRTMGEETSSPHCLSWLLAEFPIDTRSAWNIHEYFRRQQLSAGAIPHDRLIVVEGSRDEVGDPRIIVQSCFGRRVNGLLGLLLSREVQNRTGIEPQMLYNDDGILLRCSDVNMLPLDLLKGLSVSMAEGVVMNDLLGSPLFAGYFRQNAVRSLLIPKPRPGTRLPLWVQRLKAGDLLEVVQTSDDFPIVIETIREVLNDVLDFEGFKSVLHDIEQGKISIHHVQTETPSPFAASLLFDFVAANVYEGDRPKKDNLSQYLSINREILAEIVDLDSLKLRPEAVEGVEQQLQHTADGYKARSPEELLEILLRIGDLADQEVSERCETGNREMIHDLAKDGRAVQVVFSDGPRWIAGEEKEMYRNMQSESEITRILKRYILTHGPTAGNTLARRYGVGDETVAEILEKLSITGDLVKTRLTRENAWCSRLALEKIHRRTISILRKEIRPATIAQFTEFLFQWQHLHPSSRLAGSGAINNCLIQLQGLPLPIEVWERDILRSRVNNYTSEVFSSLSSSGEFVWTGAAGGKTRVLLRGEGAVFLPQDATTGRPALPESARRIENHLKEHGASFFNDIRSGARLSLQAMNNGIAELFWKGLVTNDVYEELRGIKRIVQGDADAIETVEVLDPRHNPHRGRHLLIARRALKQVPGWKGRWSLVHSPGVLGEPLSPEDQAKYQAEQLLDRYGIVARELCKREDILPWSLLAAHMQRLEMQGKIRRGYFVQGLSGMQFAHPSAVERLQDSATQSEDTEEILLVNACDPANPYGPGIDLPGKESRSSTRNLPRVPSCYIAFARGLPILTIEGFGARVQTLGESSTGMMLKTFSALKAMMNLPDHMRPFKEIVVEHFEGFRAAESPIEPTLRTLGFYKDRNQTMRFDGY